MAASQPTRSIPVGRYALAVGAPAGTLISAGPPISDDVAVETPAELEAALARDADEDQTAGELVEGAVISAAEATARVEQAEDLLRAALEGSLLDPAELSARAGTLLEVLGSLDRDGRYEEWLRFARAINGLLALAQRWAALVRSLRTTLQAAERIPDLVAAVGWAEHELGTLHLAVEDSSRAEPRLTRAQEIRQRLGDRDGLAATEQSMGVLCRQLVRARRLERPPGPERRLLLAATALLLLLAGGVAGAVVDPFDGESGARLAVLVEGRGTVTSAPAGVRCPGRCAAELPRGRSVTLTASARRGAIFAGWGGDCSGTRRCGLRLDGARSVTARFTPDAQAGSVTVRRAGDGDGRVTSASGIDCPGACRTSVERGSRIRLVATPAAGATFAGWSGRGCDGTDPCALTVNESVTITARFTATPSGESTLTVIPDGDGGGTVTSRPEGISCGNDCSEPFPQDSEVVLTHAADEGSDFAGWSGAGCSGTGDCTVTLGEAQEVIAAFELEPVVDFTLTTSTSGSGSISVTRGPATPAATARTAAATRRALWSRSARLWGRGRTPSSGPAASDATTIPPRVTWRCPRIATCRRSSAPSWTRDRSGSVGVRDGRASRTDLGRTAGRASA